MWPNFDFISLKSKHYTTLSILFLLDFIPRNIHRPSLRCFKTQTFLGRLPRSCGNNPKSIFPAKTGQSGASFPCQQVDLSDTEFWASQIPCWLLGFEFPSVDVVPQKWHSLLRLQCPLSLWPLWYFLFWKSSTGCPVSTLGLHAKWYNLSFSASTLECFQYS